MSLYYFHAFLITSAALFGFYFGLRQLSIFTASGGAMELICAASSLTASLVLLGYLVWFIKKKLLK